MTKYYSKAATLTDRLDRKCPYVLTFKTSLPDKLIFILIIIRFLLMQNCVREPV